MREAGGNSLAFPCHEAAKKELYLPRFSCHNLHRAKTERGCKFLLPRCTHALLSHKCEAAPINKATENCTHKKKRYHSSPSVSHMERPNKYCIRKRRESPFLLFLLPAAIRKSIRENGRSPIRLGGEGRRGIFALSPSHWGRREREAH